MTQLHKVLGTSIFSLLLVIVGLFMVCSGTGQDVSFEDEFFGDEVSESDSASEEEPDDEYRDELLSRLDVLDSDEEQNGAEMSDVIESLDQASAENSDQSQVDEAENFLTPELFNNMQVEVDELRTISTSKDRVLDSLRVELQDVNHELAALDNVSQTKRMASKPAKITSEDAEIYNTEFGMYYQDALDDFYVRNYDRAVRKFRELVASGGRSELVDNCQYWIGEAYFAQGNFYQAIAEFQKVLALDNSNKANDAQLMIGIAFMNAGETELARAELSTAVSFAASSNSAERARRYLRKLERA